MLKMPFKFSRMAALWTVFALFSNVAWSSDDLNKDCESKLGRHEESFLRLTQKALQDHLITPSQLGRMGRGELVDPTAGAQVRAEDFALQKALAQVFKLLKGQASPELTARWSALATELGLKNEIQQQAVAATKNLHFVTASRLAAAEWAPNLRTQFYWYRDQVGAAHLAVNNQQTLMVRTLEATRHDPVPHSATADTTVLDGDLQFQSAFTKYQGRLKLVYLNAGQLVVYDVAAATRVDTPVPGRLPQLIVVSRAGLTYITVTSESGLAVFELTSAGLVRIQDIKRGPHGLYLVEALLTAEGHLKIVARTARNEVFLYEPVGDAAPVRTWQLTEPTIRNAAATLNSRGQVLIAADAANATLAFLYEDRAPIYKRDMSLKSQLNFLRLEWKESLNDGPLLAVVDAGDVRVFRPDAADPLAHGQVVHHRFTAPQARWLTTDDGFDYLRVFETAPGVHPDHAVYRIDDNNNSRLEASYSGNVRDATFVLSPTNEWLIYGSAQAPFTLHNLTTGRIQILSDRPGAGMQTSAPFEYEPGKLAVGYTTSTGQLELVEIELKEETLP